MIEELQQNVATEIEILREISNYMIRLDYANPSERKLLLAAIESLRASMKLINHSLPKILETITMTQQLASMPAATHLQKVKFKGDKADIVVTLAENDRQMFLQELSLSESLIRKLKKKKTLEEEKHEEFRAARGYLKLSNKFFLNHALDLIHKGYFNQLSVDLRKANIDILFASYIAMILFSTVLAFIVALMFGIFFLFFSFSSSLPFISVVPASEILSRIVYIFLLPLVLPTVVFLAIFYYPQTERSSLAKKIDHEIPFVVIHMSAISGSGIEPSEIFKIIGLSKDYPYVRREIRKVLNQINLHGYDLVTALSNVSKTTPSTRLAELFSGLATTITSGGDLKEFFEKRAEGLMMNYRLEREKYNKIAETFMDMYISVVIAAPMILMVLLVLLSVSGSIGFTPGQLTTFVLLIIGLINVVFLAILHVKQPSY